MHDLKFIRQQPEAFDAGLARRGLSPESVKILALDSAWRAVETQAQELQAERNAKSEQVGKIKRDGGNADAVMAEVTVLKEKLAGLETEAAMHQQALNGMLAVLPNMPANDVPDGEDEKDNKEIHKWGVPHDMAHAKDHADLGERLGLMDFETAAKLSGSRFVVLKGALARLERALGQFMLDNHTHEFGYTECSVPVLVGAHTAHGTGNLPKFEEDLFSVINGEIGKSLKLFLRNEMSENEFRNKFSDVNRQYLNEIHWLIPTAEIPLTNFVNDMIVSEEQLPMRLTALTPCFRSEAGAAGRDTKGMLRQHQFYKVEMVSIVAPEASESEHERMTNAAETILQKLDIPYRTMLLCTGDMGFASRKTYDIEAWLPGQQKYREISSCSNCGDFQARRMHARLRRMNAKGTEFVHTLNGSGLAVGRTLIAVMENYQQADGSILVPKVLQPYMGGIEKINVPTAR